jgi:ATP-dependent RNA helicase DeaD
MYSVRIGRANKLWVLGRLLSRMNDQDQTIIFCNTKRMVDLAVQRLSKHGFSVEGLHGDLSQNQREKILKRYKAEEIKTIVATDVAARGIDVDGITLVINYDLPVDLDSFVHRIGRTGRIGRQGQAWSLVSRDDAPQLSKIMATYGLDIVETEAPELPEGIDRDPVKRQDDFGETADVFGFVQLHLDIDPATAGSSLDVSRWFTDALRCNEMAIGDVHFDNGSTYISIHTSKVGLAIKALEKREMAGQRVAATIVE